MVRIFSTQRLAWTILSLGWLLFVPCADRLWAAEPKAPTNPADLDFFENKIRPVLVSRCYGCHSQAAGKIQGGLALDSAQGMRQGGDSGPAVVPSNEERSLILAAIRHESFEMPPDGKLPAAVIADFEHWISLGAPDPRDEPAPAKAVNWDEARAFWSFRPPVATGPPQVKNADWPRSAVDQYLLAALENAQLTATADADSATWLRRVTFDLTGLPPTPEEISAFLADTSPAARETVVDGLLASPRFGERWARHWLDLARYAESNGKAQNVIWPHAWRYRDYVIAAFNADKPYNQFLREQIAGDLLPAPSPEQRDEQLVATGFLALGPKTWEEGNKWEQFQLEQTDEQIDIIGRAMLGLTLACARCHDHKFDPISAADYYALAGILNSTEVLSGPGPQNGPGYKIYSAELQPLGAEGAALHGPAQAHRQKVEATRTERGSARSSRYRYVREKQALELKRTAEKAKTPADAAALAAIEMQIAEQDAKIAEWDATITKLEESLAELEKNPPPMPDYAMAVREAKQIADCAIRIRGEASQSGKTVPRGLPALFATDDKFGISSGESGRHDLADWLASSENPLTARVAVNRIWRHLFGRGLVGTVDNFGALGERPSHPELLDQLALDFMAHGWSMKRLIRKLVLSRAYGLALDEQGDLSAADPENRLFGRRQLRRLEAEALRDSILAISGELKTVATDGSRIESAKVTGSMSLESLPAGEEERTCRAIYLTVARNAVPEMLQAFDFADPSLVLARRTERTLPGQALLLLNSPWVIRQSEIAAERLLACRVDEGDDALIRSAWQTFFGREPTAAEIGQTGEFLEDCRTSRGMSPQAAWSLVCHSLFCSAEFRYLR